MLEVRVRAIVNEALRINTFELVDPLGRELPRFEAGAHIDVLVPSHSMRQYSLCNDPRERMRYLIGVLRLDNGRGGSKAMHNVVRAGDSILVSSPRIHFALDERARRHLLIAGGIGITPIIAMVERLKAIDADFTLHYCARSPEHMAFKERLAPLRDAGRVLFHYDGGDPAKGLQLADVLGAHEAGTHLYYCGPAGMMEAIALQTSGWPAGTVHREYFAPPPVSSSVRATAVEGESGEFGVRLAGSDNVYKVPRGMSIVEVLRNAGIACNTSCEAGVCGTCRTRYLEGTPEHNDFVLSDEERQEYVMICCARATSGTLVLDLPVAPEHEHADERRQ
jgi:vanillate O-demethylase ferredoxin subunit